MRRSVVSDLVSSHRNGSSRLPDRTVNGPSGIQIISRNVVECPGVRRRASIGMCCSTENQPTQYGFVDTKCDAGGRMR